MDCKAVSCGFSAPLARTRRAQKSLESLRNSDGNPRRLYIQLLFCRATSRSVPAVTSGRFPLPRLTPKSVLTPSSTCTSRSVMTQSSRIFVQCTQVPEYLVAVAWVGTQLSVQTQRCCPGRSLASDPLSEQAHSRAVQSNRIQLFWACLGRSSIAEDIHHPVLESDAAPCSVRLSSQNEMLLL